MTLHISESIEQTLKNHWIQEPKSLDSRTQFLGFTDSNESIDPILTCHQDHTQHYTQLSNLDHIWLHTASNFNSKMASHTACCTALSFSMLVGYC